MAGGCFSRPPEKGAPNAHYNQGEDTLAGITTIGTETAVMSLTCLLILILAILKTDWRL